MSIRRALTPAQVLVMLRFLGTYTTFAQLAVSMGKRPDAMAFINTYRRLTTGYTQGSGPKAATTTGMMCLCCGEPLAPPRYKSRVRIYCSTSCMAKHRHTTNRREGRR